MSVHYHPGKANVVADALSKLSMGSVAHVDDERKELVKDVHRLARLGVRLMRISDSGMTQDIDIPTWKWDVINMDFITRLPRTRRYPDSI